MDQWSRSSEPRPEADRSPSAAWNRALTVTWSTTEDRYIGVWNAECRKEQLKRLESSVQATLDFRSS
eukprot:1452270-Alexandrium_andersonii.AAC.1